MKRKLWIPLTIISILALVLLVGCSSPAPAAATTQAPSLFDRMAAVETQSSTSSASISKLTTDLTTAQSDLKSNESSIANITQQITQINTKLGQTQPPSTPSNMATTGDINSLTSQLTTLNQNLTKAQSDSATLKQQITDLQSQITKAQSDNATLKQQMADLQSQITKTDTPTPTSTATPTSGLTPLVLGNAWSGSQMLSFTPSLTANATTTQSFNYNLINTTGKTVTGIQLAVGLELLDVGSNVLQLGLPHATFSLASSGLSTIWSAQSTGYNYLLGFTNTSTSGVFGGIGILTQAPGTVIYSLAVTITTDASYTPSYFNVFPIIKVVSFTTQ